MNGAIRPLALHRTRRKLVSGLLLMAKLFFVARSGHDLIDPSLFSRKSVVRRVCFCYEYACIGHCVVILATLSVGKPRPSVRVGVRVGHDIGVGVGVGVGVNGVSVSAVAVASAVVVVFLFLRSPYLVYMSGVSRHGEEM